MKKSLPSEPFTLLTGLAQEINAPLKSLLLSSQKLLDTYKGKNFEYISYKDFKHMLTTLEQINKQVNRCYQTTQRLVGLHKIRQGVCDINQVIGDIVELLEQQFQTSNIKQYLRLSKTLPKVRLHRIDGHQIIHNILANAMHAMPAGGKLKIRTTLDKKKNFIIVDIIDEGVGIKPNHLSKVFDPFFTTTQEGAHRSSGLGLSVVYSIIQSAGGSIHIQSSLRKGTQVKIFLPAV